MAAVALTAALALGPTPFFHTELELDDWQAGWVDQMLAGETSSLIADFLDMSERHPCRLVECPLVKEVASAGRTRPPATTPPPGNSGMGDDVEQWRNLVAAYFPPEEVDWVLRVMACESGGNPNAYNPSGASGLMQILASWADNFGLTPAQLFDPATNLQVARYLWDDGGWTHWNASRGCW